MNRMSSWVIRHAESYYATRMFLPLFDLSFMCRMNKS